MTERTTIQISKSTWRRLKEMKADKIKSGEYEDDSFDYLITELLDLKDSAIYAEEIEKLE